MHKRDGSACNESQETLVAKAVRQESPKTSSTKTKKQTQFFDITC